jgi:hypothetical protein
MLASTTTQQSFAGNNKTGASAAPNHYEITFPLAAAADLVCIETSSAGTKTTRSCTLTPQLDGNGRITGGTAVTSVAIPVTSTVLFKRVTPREQTTNITQGSRLGAEALESALDRQMMILQEIERDFDARLDALEA